MNTETSRFQHPHLEINPDIKLHFQPAEKVFGRLKNRFGIDIFALQASGYTPELPYANADESPGQFKTKSVTHVSDLDSFFPDDPKKERTYFRWISRHHFPKKQFKQYKDILVVEEIVPNGKTLSLVQYDVNPYFLKDKTGQKTKYRPLLGHFLINNNNEVADLFPQNKEIKIGVTDNQSWHTEDQIRTLKDSRIFLFTDKQTPNLNILSKLNDLEKRLRSRPLERFIKELTDPDNDPNLLTSFNERLGLKLTTSELVDLIQMFRTSYPQLDTLVDRLSLPKKPAVNTRMFSNLIHQASRILRGQGADLSNQEEQLQRTLSNQ